MSDPVDAAPDAVAASDRDDATTPRPLAVVDIDGVVADVSHRLHHLDRRPKDWTSFFAAAGRDPVHDEGVALVELLDRRCDVVFLTGRPRTMERDTQDWLDRHGLGDHQLVMREVGDRRPAAVVKPELLATLARGRDVEVVVDDDPQVLEAMDAAGYTTYRADWEALDADSERVLRDAQEHQGRT